MKQSESKQDLRQEWYRLDNAATFYSLVSSPRATCMFRIEASLKKPVNIKNLQLALDGIIERFPYYRVNLVPGLFWHFWNTNPAKPHVIADSQIPCEAMPVTRDGIFPFRVRAFKNRVAAEFHHSITDGTGGIVFFKALLAEYLVLSGKKGLDRSGIARPEETPELSEYEDAYKRYYKKSVPSPLKETKVFPLPFKADKHRPYTRTTGILSLSRIKSAVKKLNVSLTEFLAALLIDSFQEVLFAIPLSKRKKYLKPIRLMVPVNLRNIYPSKTMRNFSLYVNPEIDPRLGRYSFPEILKEVFHYMRVVVNEKYINKQIKRNVRAELHPLLRVTPLFLKKPVIKIAANVFFTSVNNAVFTNMGIFDLPAGFRDEIDDFQFFLPPGRDMKICLSVSSYKGRLYLNFGRAHREPEIEKFFFRKLVGMGVRVKVTHV